MPGSRATFVKICACAESASHRFAEASTFHYWWACAEDYVLTAWLEEALKSKPTHLSLHFDGIRMTMPPGGDVDLLCKRHMAAIEELWHPNQWRQRV